MGMGRHRAGVDERRVGQGKAHGNGVGLRGSGGSHVISDHMLQIRCNWLVRKATGTEEEMSKEGCWTDGETGNATSLLLHQTLRVD